jgi:hypothetical protein
MATSAQLLNQIQGKTVEQMQANEAAFVASQSGANAAAALSESAASTLRATAEAQATIVREDYIAKQKVEQAQRTAALAAGYDPALGAGPMLDRIAAINKKGSEVVDLTKKLRAERSVSIFEDPLAWVQANFLSDTQEQVGMAAAELETESAVLGQLNQAVQQTARTAEATAQTVTAAKIEAATKVAATDANLKAFQAEQEGIRFRTAAVTARAELSNADLNALHTLRNATLAEQNYKLNLQQEARAREQFNWQKEFQKISLEEKKAAKELDGYLTETINYGNRLLGRPELTGMDAKVMVQLLKKGGTEELNRLYQMGLSYRMNPKNPIVGPDPASAYDNLVSLQGRVTETQKGVVEVLRDVQASMPRTAFDPKTGKMIDTKGYNQTVQDTFAGQFQSIRPGSGNPFDVGDVTPYVTASPELQSLPFIQQVISPAITAKQPLQDPKVVIDLAIESAKRGDITLPQAISGVINIYQRANAMNQAARGFVSFGIVPPQGGLAYNSRLGFGATVNLADPVAVGRYMSIEMVKSTTGMFNPGARLRAADQDFSKEFGGIK